MLFRSWLVVPAQSEKRLTGAVGSGADAVVVDLVEGDALAGRKAVRQRAFEWLDAHRAQVIEHPFARWVRINPLDAGTEWREDLLAVLPAAPDGIILPRAAGPEAVRQLAAELYEIEQRFRIAANSTGIIPMVGETAQAVFTLAHFVEQGHQRIFALGWNPDPLAREIGARRTSTVTGECIGAFGLARAQALLSAHASGWLALDSAPRRERDDERLVQLARNARADGFSGMFAYHPAQVQAINEAFTPDDADLRQALEVVAAFEAGSGGLAPIVGGQPLSASHVRLARRTLGQEHAPRQTQQEARPILRPA